MNPRPDVQGSGTPACPGWARLVPPGQPLTQADLQLLLERASEDALWSCVERRHRPGPDGVKWHQLRRHWRAVGAGVIEAAASGTYVPGPVYYVGRAHREDCWAVDENLVDRVLSLALLRGVLYPAFEPLMRPEVLGFRPGQNPKSRERAGRALIESAKPGDAVVVWSRQEELELGELEGELLAQLRSRCGGLVAELVRGLLDRQMLEPGRPADPDSRTLPGFAPGLTLAPFATNLAFLWSDGVVGAFNCPGLRFKATYHILHPDAEAIVSVLQGFEYEAQAWQVESWRRHMAYHLQLPPIPTPSSVRPAPVDIQAILRRLDWAAERRATREAQATRRRLADHVDEAARVAKGEVTCGRVRAWWSGNRQRVMDELGNGTWWPRRPRCRKDDETGRDTQNWPREAWIISKALSRALRPLLSARGRVHCRRGRGCATALAAVGRRLLHGHLWACVVDVKNCFDQIPREPLFALLGRKVAQDVLQVVQRFCSVGAGRGPRGIGQGAPHCPIVSDLYLSGADLGERYADESWFSEATYEGTSRLTARYLSRLVRLQLEARVTGPHPVEEVVFLGVVLTRRDGKLVAVRPPDYEEEEDEYIESTQQRLDRLTHRRRSRRRHPDHE